MRTCKQCQDELTSDNVAYTGTYNRHNQRYMDNVCRFCKQSQRRNRLNLLNSHPKPAEDTPCDCCGRVRELYLDHDHSTRAFRGWICRQCNHGIGHLSDNLTGLQKAVVYLQRCQQTN